MCKRAKYESEEKTIKSLVLNQESLFSYEDVAKALNITKDDKEASAKLRSVLSQLFDDGSLTTIGTSLAVVSPFKNTPITA